MTPRTSGRSSGRRAFDTWQIIYIDLMTNVMIFFVILWAIQNRASHHGISDTVGTETVKMVNLPGDVLFSSGASEMSEDGRRVFTGSSPTTPASCRAGCCTSARRRCSFSASTRACISPLSSS